MAAPTAEQMAAHSGAHLVALWAEHSAERSAAQMVSKMAAVWVARMVPMRAATKVEYSVV